ncbi:hypothetical protein KKJ01_21185 [Xenorhabdus bovienii]|uniref:Inclusion body protein n=1 Tax=Xenorhabdus bovienii TaxID=40576 RepID=A0AAJ1JBM3_XENBV|nr:AidA/PixA family protein [Xenorhabdus bovienii]MDE1480629.1 hypothetical protein [Xenorhabdus bovienii]MDE9512344.1 hypothetical protein [Xenorhabdus bovienii]MDE9523983.1 hypothetical protein [Xenorhabdus bovienii]
MTDINISIALDLKNIVDLGNYSIDFKKKKRISDQYVHVLAPKENLINDYGGVNAIISDVDIGDRVNWTVVNYSEYNSELSAVLINYTLVNPQGSVSTPEIELGSFQRPYIIDSSNIEGSMSFNNVGLYYWTSNIKSFNVTEKYNGILKIYKGKVLLGYAYFEQSMTFEV